MGLVKFGSSAILNYFQTLKLYLDMNEKFGSSAILNYFQTKQLGFTVED